MSPLPSCPNLLGAQCPLRAPVFCPHCWAEGQGCHNALICSLSSLSPRMMQSEETSEADLSQLQTQRERAVDRAQLLAGLSDNQGGSFKKPPNLLCFPCSPKKKSEQVKGRAVYQAAQISCDSPARSRSSGTGLALFSTLLTPGLMRLF